MISANTSPLILALYHLIATGGLSIPKMDDCSKAVPGLVPFFRERFSEVVVGPLYARVAYAGRTYSRGLSGPYFAFRPIGVAAW